MTLVREPPSQSSERSERCVREMCRLCRGAHTCFYVLRSQRPSTSFRGSSEYKSSERSCFIRPLSAIFEVSKWCFLCQDSYLGDVLVVFLAVWESCITREQTRAYFCDLSYPQGLSYVSNAKYDTEVIDY